ncbi:hypothetical protein K501DRAFT_16425 [Backusella circina FSU 941]|nr:hypothetical protein K501DRAFT_16425 [Backusella circina FSU 941]
MSAQWVFGHHADPTDQPYDSMCKNQEGWVNETFEMKPFFSFLLCVWLFMYIYLYVYRDLSRKIVFQTLLHVLKIRMYLSNIFIWLNSPLTYSILFFI